MLLGAEFNLGSVITVQIAARKMGVLKGDTEGKQWVKLVVRTDPRETIYHQQSTRGTDIPAVLKVFDKEKRLCSMPKVNPYRRKESTSTRSWAIGVSRTGRGCHKAL